MKNWWLLSKLVTHVEGTSIILSSDEGGHFMCLPSATHVREAVRALRCHPNDLQPDLQEGGPMESVYPKRWYTDQEGNAIKGEDLRRLHCRASLTRAEFDEWGKGLVEEFMTRWKSTGLGAGQALVEALSVAGEELFK